jgi:arylformamidase
LVLISFIIYHLSLKNVLADFHFFFHGKGYRFDPLKPLDLSLPIEANNENPNCYYAESPIFHTIRAGDFVGSVAEGGKVNYQKITFTPHGNGTHTETYGHISADKDATLYNCLKQHLFFAQIITITPQENKTKENKKDHIILWENIKKYFGKIIPEAVILRTLPNSLDKKNKQYTGTNPPYLEEKIGKKLADFNVKHLLVDLPSVDREIDGGVLACHHAFWQYPHNTRKDCTITELIYVPDEIPDGFYLLQLQPPNFQLDAFASKIVVYALERF